MPTIFIAWKTKGKKQRRRTRRRSRAGENPHWMISNPSFLLASQVFQSFAAFSCFLVPIWADLSVASEYSASAFQYLECGVNRSSWSCRVVVLFVQFLSWSRQFWHLEPFLLFPNRMWSKFCGFRVKCRKLDIQDMFLIWRW